jgi:drug/metabolite transporter (DMT)-like permease
LRTKVAAAFAAVYLIWGSTYLAIRFAIETIPPFFMAGTRFITAGLFLYACTRFGGSPKPSLAQWRNAALIGGLMLMGGNGAVVWAEQWLPSGLTALIVATVPLWMALLHWIGTRNRLDTRAVVGLILGFAGVSLLMASEGVMAEAQATVIGGAVLILGTLSWASGSLYSRSARLPSSSLLGAGMQMVAGGAFLLITSLATGELTRVRPDQLSVRSAFSWVYLIVVGALIGYTSYMWLLKTVTPQHVSTYAYVNPVVALFLGWGLANETLSVQDMVATVIILISVVIITTYGSLQKTVKKAEPDGRKT